MATFTPSWSGGNIVISFKMSSQSEMRGGVRFLHAKTIYQHIRAATTKCVLVANAVTSMAAENMYIKLSL